MHKGNKLIIYIVVLKFFMETRLALSSVFRPFGVHMLRQMTLMRYW